MLKHINIFAFLFTFFYLFYKKLNRHGLVLLIVFVCMNVGHFLYAENALWGKDARDCSAYELSENYTGNYVCLEQSEIIIINQLLKFLSIIES